VQNSDSLVDHFFRREYGRIVSILTRSFGIQSLDLVEDAIQTAMARAIVAWRTGVPDNPSAWLYQTAKNCAIDAIRRSRFERVNQNGGLAFDDGPIAAIASTKEPLEAVDETIADESLRLLFLCCCPDVPLESRIAFALKLVSGFGTTEIASALLISSSNVEKRIARAKERMRTLGRELADVDSAMFRDRIQSVQATLYLMFSEGYASSWGPTSLRLDLCTEAIRLTRILIDQCPDETEATCALLAIMLFHSARFDARFDTLGSIVLLEDQDRDRWNWALIREGMDWMRRSAAGQHMSRYHIEAAIAWEHCRASDFASIEWNQVYLYYNTLRLRYPGPMVDLNRAIALGYHIGHIHAIEELGKISGSDRSKLRPWWDCAMANAYRHLGKLDVALGHFQDAMQLATNPQQRELLSRQIHSVESKWAAQMK
jgi:RNA polymerase sigma factor (sigma-70 family)